MKCEADTGPNESDWIGRQAHGASRDIGICSRIDWECKFRNTLEACLVADCGCNCDSAIHRVTEYTVSTTTCCYRLLYCEYCARRDSPTHLAYISNPNPKRKGIEPQSRISIPIPVQHYSPQTITIHGPNSNTPWKPREGMRLSHQARSRSQAIVRINPAQPKEASRGFVGIDRSAS